MTTQHRIWAYGDNVNTDVIFPGKYTYTLKTREDIAAKALEDLDPTFAANAREGDVIVAGRNWGNGSSREQAVTALKYCGVKAIIAESFGGIYFRNCINQGILPIVLTGVQQRVQTGDTLELDIAEAQLHIAGQTFVFPRLSPSVQAIYNAGGLVPMLAKRFPK
jgi:3-isopropylmalate/(R)-2-methylmalate dehydratase small subunit